MHVYILCGFHTVHYTWSVKLHNLFYYYLAVIFKFCFEMILVYFRRNFAFFCLIFVNAQLYFFNFVLVIFIFSIFVLSYFNTCIWHWVFYSYECHSVATLNILLHYCRQTKIFFLMSAGYEMIGIDFYLFNEIKLNTFLQRNNHVVKCSFLYSSFKNLDTSFTK